jgi:hypothetical protein
VTEAALPNAPLALYRLAVQIGPDRISQLLQQLAARYSARPATLRDFVVLASAFLGRDVGPQAMPYLCPPAPGPSPGTFQVTPCL